MSNHSGSYMLNNVICMADKMGILETIGKEKTKEFILEILRIGRHYDCNSGEMLESLDKFGICYCCYNENHDLEDGLCKECRE